MFQISSLSLSETLQNFGAPLMIQPLKKQLQLLQIPPYGFLALWTGHVDVVRTLNTTSTTTTTTRTTWTLTVAGLLNGLMKVDEVGHLGHLDVRHGGGMHDA